MTAGKTAKESNMKKYTLCMTAMLALLPTFVSMLAGCDTGTSSGGNTDSTVSIVSVTGVSLDKTSGELYMKTTAALTAAVVPANATNKAVTWSTSDPAIATVAGGVVTPVAAGQATITVTTADGGKTAACVLTVCNPVDINDAAGLLTIDDSPANMSKSYKLTADITISAPIGLMSGDPVSFTGDFDGNGKTVTLNITSGLTVSNGTYAGTFAGLFAVVGDLSGNAGTRGTVHDLKVAGTINVSGAATAVFAGGVAGVTTPSAAVTNVVSSVAVTAAGSGDVFAGGIVGAAQGAVSNTYATGNVSATGGEDVHAGGIVGAAQGAVSNVYTTGNVSAKTTSTDSAYAGGIAGTAGSEVMSYAYTTGSISAEGTGTGNGIHNDPTIGAGGIAGAATHATVRYTVALNSSVAVINSTSYNRCSYRIASTSGGEVTTNGATNYGKSDLAPSGCSYTPPMHTGADKEDGVDVTVTSGTPYTAPTETWWRNTGFSGSDWATVWEWDGTTGLPKLR